MSNRWQQMMRAHAQMAGQLRLSVRIGTVSAYDPDAYAVKVQFPPDTIESGWLPIASPFVGPSWGLQAAPLVGEQAVVVFQEGDIDAGVVAGFLFNDEDRPQSVSAGEFWLQHKNGAFFKLTNDGKAQFNDGHGASVVLNGDGTITSAGTWTHQGAMTVQNNFTVNGDTAVKAITSNSHDISSTHKHTGVTTGSGVSGTPQ